MKILKFFPPNDSSKIENVKEDRNYYSSTEALVKLGALNLGYLPWTSSSMTPQSIVYILNEIIINKRRRIMELGMGLSTVFIARLMQEIKDIQLLSVDHDKDWIDLCSFQLASKCLDTDRHTVIHAPLAEQKNAKSETFNYYNFEALGRGKAFKPDLVIIDGPPAWREDISDARVPAYEILSPLVNSSATVFIDDYPRKGESKLLNLFLSDPDWTLSHKDSDANVAILRNTRAEYNAY